MKKWGFALSTLGERPRAILSCAFMLVVAAYLPSMADGATTTDLLWRETLIVPGVIGYIVGTACAEVRAGMFAWTLPSLDRKLFLGSLAALLITVACLTFYHFAANGRPATGFGLACLAFATGTLGRNIGRPQGFAWVELFLCILCVKVRWLIAVVAAEPTAVSFLATVAALAFLAIDQSRAARRKRAALNWERDTDTPKRSWLDRVVPANKERGSRLRAGTMREWIHITRDPAGKGQLRVSAELVQQATIVATIGFVMSSPSTSFIMLMTSMASPTARGPAGGFPYPLTRRKRATICFASNLINIFVLCATAALVTSLLVFLVPMLHIHLFSHTRRAAAGEWLPFLASVLITLPLLQWFPTQPPVTAHPTRLWGESLGFTLAFVLFMVIATVFLAFFLMWIQKARATLFYALCLTLIVTSHYAYLRLLQQSFMTKDLV